MPEIPKISIQSIGKFEVITYTNWQKIRAGLRIILQPNQWSNIALWKIECATI